jgi:hypothetical protein
MRYVCGHPRRLTAVKRAGLLNGIEYLEVRDTEEPVQALRQRTLYVRLLDPPDVDSTTTEVVGLVVVIEGGERITPVEVDWIARGDTLTGGLADLVAGIPKPDHVLVVRTARRGDFSRYRLRLVAGPGSTSAPSGYDPLLVTVDFSFKVECPSDFDCRAACTCPPGVHHRPVIDYLAKDFSGFRRLMTERVALLAPDWQERSAADVGMAVIEALAYVADELSYRQDAVATEAYLDTARSRISLRRHARLVDYRVHEGCNARAWVHLEVSEPTVTLGAGTPILSGVPGLPPVIEPDSLAHRTAMAARPVVFETVDSAVLHSDLNELRFWTWGEQGCCLPAGATAASLRGDHPLLRAGDVLVLAEKVPRPAPGGPAPEPPRLFPERDPERRVAVRLVEVTSAADPSGSLFPDGTSAVTEIRWHPDDALPIPLCLGDGDNETAVAWGNIMLADHGETVADEPLGEVPVSRLLRVPADPCAPDPQPAPPRYRPTLQRRPLTHAVAAPAEVLVTAALTPSLMSELGSGQSADGLQALFATVGVTLPDGSPVRGGSPLWSVSADGRAWLLRRDSGQLQVLAAATPAAEGLAPTATDALPSLSLMSTLGVVTESWAPQPDLLASDQAARELTVETEEDQTTYLRFGDGEHGRRPAAGTTFTATYRVGNGTTGNVGRDSLAHVVTGVDGITGVTNPVPAAGGVDPETPDEIRRDAPVAVPERAVTRADYAEVAQRNPGVARAEATFRWTGSWHTVFVTADRVGGAPVDELFECDLRGWLERFRMAGYDLEVDAPVFVALEVGLHVCVSPGYFRSDVASEVRAVLSHRALPDGRLGLFHPDRLTFGHPVHLSAILAAVHSVQGVQSVQVVTFQRQRQPQTSGIEDGVLPMGRLEIARLDDDPNFPEHGVLDLTFGGGS